MLAMEREQPNVFAAMQFENPANPDFHEASTAPEMWEQMQGQVDALVLGVGTAGTFTGLARYFKRRLPNILTVAVESEGSVYAGGEAGPHEVEGIGASMLPATFDRSVCDRVMTVTDVQAFHMARRMAAEEGLFAGGSAGAIMHAAVAVAKELGPAARVAMIVPDSAERYLSKGHMGAAQ